MQTSVNCVYAGVCTPISGSWWFSAFFSCKNFLNYYIGCVRVCFFATWFWFVLILHWYFNQSIFACVMKTILFNIRGNNRLVCDRAKVLADWLVLFLGQNLLGNSFFSVSWSFISSAKRAEFCKICIWCLMQEIKFFRSII